MVRSFPFRWTAAAMAMALATACGTDRDAPPTSSAPPSGAMTSGAGGTAATTSSGGGDQPTAVTCDQQGVVCDFQSYFGDCTMFSDRRTLWEFLQYACSVPGDSRIDFSVRTADTEDELSAANFVLAGVAELGSEVVPPFAPIQLRDVLDLGDTDKSWLELRFKRIDSTDSETPTVDEWDLQFSCVEF